MQRQNGVSPRSIPSFTLEPVDLFAQDDFDEMLRQRKICGWKQSIELIQQWRDANQRGSQFMWWITIPPQHNNSEDDGDNDHDVSNTSHQSYTIDQSRKVGHVTLTSENSLTKPDPELARADRTILQISTLFILPSHRKSGLGRAVMEAVEERARCIPECQQVTVDALDRRYLTDDSPEWGGQLIKHKVPNSNRLITEDWYVRMGYERFKGYEIFSPVWNDQLRFSCLRKWIA